MRHLDGLRFAIDDRIVGVLTDIDDTLTTDGRLPADAYAALERLEAAGLLVIAITGRPAGWCDMIARFWPVAGVVGENGAFYFRHDRREKRMIRRFHADEAERRANRQALDRLAARILAEVPGAAVASDQLYREADLAIDFCEDVPPLDQAAVGRIVALFEEAGAVAKVSSIHVNGWFGHYDKLTMTRRLLAEVFGIDLDRREADFVYCGDSPNDAPMFAFFRHACGVANVADFAHAIHALPAFVAPSRGGAGFVEIANMVIAARGPAQKAGRFRGLKG
jgi:HAD superfamily hydrolase (TIGR01484 family)